MLTPFPIANALKEWPVTCSAQADHIAILVSQGYPRIALGAHMSLRAYSYQSSVPAPPDPLTPAPDITTIEF